MKNILNPILKDGHHKVKCIHYYELCLSKSYVYFIAIFVFNDHIWLYRVENDNKSFSMLTDYGEIEPLNMQKAVNNFKNLII